MIKFRCRLLDGDFVGLFLFLLAARFSAALSAVFAGSAAHDFCVDSAAHAVDELVVDFGELEVFQNLPGHDIVARGGITNVSHGELLNSLVLRHKAAAVRAGQRAGVSAVLLASSIVSALTGHL